ncbi:ribonuclease iii, partial [Colletotrichum incanum]
LPCFALFISSPSQTSFLNHNINMEAHRENNLTKVQTASGYVFNNPDWAWIAVQQAGSPVRAVGEHALPQGNKRLAGLGDRIVAMLIVDAAFAADLSIGDTNRMLSQFGSNEYLATICDQHELTSCIIVNPAQNGVVHTNLKATTVEALIGAVYKDAGDDFDAAREVAKFLGIIPTLAS